MEGEAYIFVGKTCNKSQKKRDYILSTYFNKHKVTINYLQ